MTTGWPKTYYAVIFTSQRTDVEHDLYVHTANQMVALAQKQPGFLGVETVREEKGLGITVSYWKDKASIKAWSEHADHKLAKQLGKTDFYSWYQLRIAKVETSNNFGLDDL